MKTFSEYVNEASDKIIKVTNRNILKVVKSEIERLGPKADLNHIDVSKVTDFTGLFSAKNGLKTFNGNISKWNVSKATSMNSMFRHSQFTGDISDWDVSNVTDMNFMFAHSQFNGDISKWDVSKTSHVSHMFIASKFNGDISKWDVSSFVDMSDMFRHSVFNKDISKWKLTKVVDMSSAFVSSKFTGDISKWNIPATGVFVANIFADSALAKSGNIPRWWYDIDILNS